MAIKNLYKGCLAARKAGVLGKLAGVTLLALSTLLGAKAHAEADRLQGLIEPVVASKPLKIGITVVHLMDNFFTGIAYGIMDEAKRSGVNVVQFSAAGNYGNVKEQFAQLEAFKSLGVDYAVLSPAAYAGYDPVIADLAKSGVKTISAGIPVNSKNVTFGVLQDDFEIGTALGKAVCDDGGKGKKVIVVPGSAGLEWSRLRYEGFKEAATACGAVLTDPAFQGDMTLASGMAQTQDLLMRHQDAEYLFTPASYLAMGAAQAVRQSGRKVKVVTATMVKEEEQMIRDGRMLAVVSEPGIVMGRLIVQYAIRQNEGLPMPSLTEPTQSVPYPHYNVPIVMVTKENVDTHPYDLYEYPPKDWRVGSR